MKPKKYTNFFLLVGIVFGVMMVCLYIKRSRNAMTVPQVEKMIQVEVPRDSNKSQVATFLNSKGIEHSYLDGKKIDLGTVSNVVLSGFSPADLSGITTAIIRDTSRQLFISGDLQIIFFYDKRGRLIKYTVKEVFTGP